MKRFTTLARKEVSNLFAYIIKIKLNAFLFAPLFFKFSLSIVSFILVNTKTKNTELCKRFNLIT